METSNATNTHKPSVRRRALPWLALPFAALILSACTPPPADEVIIVTTTVDSVDGDPNDGFCRDFNDECSLRAAVMHANTDPDVTEIRLQDGAVYPLTLTGFGDTDAIDDLDLHESTYIRVAGGTATIDAGGIDRVIEVHGGDFQYLEGLVITGGNPGFDEGGGVKISAGLVGIEDTRITGNTAAGGGGVSVEGGTLWMENSTVDNNIATAFGGGGLTIFADAHIFQTTISGNQSSVGPAIAAFAPGDVDIILSTIADNLGGLTIFNSGGTIDFAASAIDGGDDELLCAGGGTYVSSGYNVASHGSCGFVGTGDTVAPSLLFPLGDNGGPVPTHLPAANSPVMNRVPTGTAPCVIPVAADARGVARPGDAGCETGAVEVLVGDSPGSDCIGPKVTSLGPDANLQYCPLLSFQGYAAQTLEGSDLTGSSLQGSTMPSGVFIDTNLTDVDLRNFIIGSTPAFSNVDLSGANMTGSTFVAPAFDGATFDNTICPDGTNSDDNDGDGGTCVNNYL